MLLNLDSLFFLCHDADGFCGLLQGMEASLNRFKCKYFVRRLEDVRNIEVLHLVSFSFFLVQFIDGFDDAPLSCAPCLLQQLGLPLAATRVNPWIARTGMGGTHGSFRYEYLSYALFG